MCERSGFVGDGQANRLQVLKNALGEDEALEILSGAANEAAMAAAAATSGTAQDFYAVSISQSDSQMTSASLEAIPATMHPIVQVPLLIFILFLMEITVYSGSCPDFSRHNAVIFQGRS